MAFEPAPILDTYNRLRNVGGRAAYWNVPTGGYMELRTGRPVSEYPMPDIAALRGTPAPTGPTAVGGDWTYGESYGGIEAGEQAKLQAERNWLLNLAQLNESIRRANIQDQRQRELAEIAASTRLGEAEIGAEARLRAAQDAIRQRQFEEQGRNYRAGEGNDLRYQIADERNQAQIADELAGLEEAGAGYADELGATWPQLNNLMADYELAQQDFNKARQAADTAATGGVLRYRGRYLEPTEPAYESFAAERNIALRDASERLKKLDADLRAAMRNSDNTVRNLRREGFQLSMNSVKDPRTGNVYRIPSSIENVLMPPTTGTSRQLKHGGFFIPRR